MQLLFFGPKRRSHGVGPGMEDDMHTVLPLAVGAVMTRVLGVLALAFGATVVRFSQSIGLGIANSIIRRPDLITDRQPPRDGLRESSTFFGRCIGAFLVLWGALWILVGGAALLGLGHWG
ncbi:MAG: hypothetical protein QOH13_1937 [Thermoleophilaceae bacterium]|nr:hypothetical protein [Thermoleophilaceae bacterium]